MLMPDISINTIQYDYGFGENQALFRKNTNFQSGGNLHIVAFSIYL